MTTSTDGPALARVRLHVAYDGTPFRGFAANDGVDTVAGRLNEALSTVVRAPVVIVGAGRTDAGVHARAQVVSADVPAHVDLAQVQRSVNALCAPHIVVRDIAWADADFHARFSAKWRRYEYTVLNAATPDPFLLNTAWHVREPLRVHAMRLACDAIIGEHDFTSFCKRPPTEDGQQPASMGRYVMQAKWEQKDDVLSFHIKANAFCHQMVRSIVGLMVDIGQGKHLPSDMRRIMLAKDRTQNAPLAPPHGLCLVEVGY
jgi:tRNA pseudouridine38-40 synthase